MPEFDDRNTVTVMIYGREYTVSGDMPRGAIMKAADYVNEKMSEAGGDGNLPVSKVAILSAMMIAGELFDELKNHEDKERYEKLWEEAKNGFGKARDDLAKAEQRISDLIKQNSEKDRQLAALYSELAEVKKHNEVLRSRIEELSEELETRESAPDASKKRIDDLEARCRGLESSFFDVQMENIRLKTENERMKKKA